jgi:hypothetical protein
MAVGFGVSRRGAFKKTRLFFLKDGEIKTTRRTDRSMSILFPCLHVRFHQGSDIKMTNDIRRTAFQENNEITIRV